MPLLERPHMLLSILSWVFYFFGPFVAVLRHHGIGDGLLWALIVVVLCAAIDEFHQSFVPTRMGSYVDVGIDTAGGILALFVIALCHRHRKK